MFSASTLKEVRRNSGLIRLGLSFSAMVFILFSTGGSALAAIGYVQGAYAVPQTPQTTVTVTYAQAQAAGDLSVVVVGWADNTAQVNTVTDTKGNVYQLAVGPTMRAGSAQSIYYAKNIVSAAAGANAVTVTFTVGAQYPDIRIVEYSGIDTINPLDVTTAATGTVVTSNSGTVATTTANDLLVGANDVQTYTSAAGSGYTKRLLTTDGDIVEDRVVTATGSYSATATLNSAGGWVMQMVAFRAAGSAPPDTTPPTVPSNLTPQVISSSQINLSWTASTDASSPITYHVERCQGAGCSTFAEIAAPAATTFSNTGLTASTSYSYRVRASDPSNNFSGYSSTVTATTQATGDTTPPTAPSNLTAQVISSSQINLSWTASTDASSPITYHVERCQGAGCSTFAEIAAPTATTFNDTGLATGTSYSYRVRATDPSNNFSGYSNTAAATTTGDTTPPTVPSNLTAQAASSSQINLSWTASTDASSPITYHVERCQGAGCSTFAEIAAPAATTFSNTGLSPSTSYSYRVRASDPANNFSGYSNTAGATTSGSGSATTGQWSAVFTWPMVGIHMTLMPNGKVLTWEDENASPAAQVWDPATSGFTAVPYTAFDLFCAGHTVLPDGRIMVAGGHNGANWNGLKALTFFNPGTLTWSTGPNMTYARWYPTVTALPDGRQLVTSGAINCEGCNANTPEIYNPATNSWTQLTSATINLPLYPHMFVIPDGRVLVTGTYEQPVTAQALNLNTLTWTTIDSHTYDEGSAVMYVPGKILKSGTSANSDPPYVNAVRSAYVLDMTQASPAWRQTNSMTFARSYHNLTVLPDGTVLATGGESYTDPTNLSSAVRAAELWSPGTEQWTALASMQNARVYHSTALLLPDGRVVVAGSGEYGPGSVDQLNGEIFSPPYLFKGARPAITSAPSNIQFTQQFTVQTPDAANITSVALIRLGSVTHAFDENQRYVPLTFTIGGGSLTVTAPANANLAPVGHYMLFIVNSSGVPSVAPILTLTTAPGGAVPTAPTNLTGTPTTGRVVLTWNASSSAIGIANYNVYRSTTSNFTPSSGNRIGQPLGTTFTDTDFTTSGTYYYLVTAQDTAGAESTPSNQATVIVSADSTPPTVSVTAPASGAVVSGNVTVSANASDDVVVSNVQFQADGVNIGSPITTTPYSTAWSTSGVPNGSHTLTAIATNGAHLATTSAAIPVSVNNTGPANISFVQSNYATPQTPQSTVNVTFTAAQSAGDLNVIAVGWSDSTSLITSITDTKGNLYQLAVGPTSMAGLQSQAIYYAKNIAAANAGGNTVKVTFNGTVAYPDVRILEYSGLDTANPLDVTAAATGTGTTSSASATTTNANDLLFAANYVTSFTNAPGAGFTRRIIDPDGDIAEDQIVSAIGSYTASASMNSGSWIMQMVAFRAAGGLAPLAPPPASR